jgi:hypothetical protein
MDRRDFLNTSDCRAACASVAWPHPYYGPRRARVAAPTVTPAVSCGSPKSDRAGCRGSGWVWTQDQSLSRISGSSQRSISIEWCR